METAARIKRLLPRNRFIRSVSILAGGTAAGQAIVVLASPLLTRLYTPEDFGLLAVYGALLGIIAVVASLRYQLAIPLPESNEEAAHIVVLSLTVVLGMTVLTAIAVLLFRGAIASTLNAPVLAGYLWLLPVGLLLTGIYQVFNYWAIRVKAFPAIARTKLTQSLGMVAVQVGGYSLGPIALLAGRVLGQAVGTVSLGVLAVRERWTTIHDTRCIDVRRAASRYRHFPVYSSWAGLLNTGGTQLPPLLFAIFYGASAAGLYMLAHRILTLPITLVGGAIADVFMPRSLEALRESRLKEVVETLHLYLARIAMPPAILLFVSAPELFRYVFGENWYDAGHVARWLAPVLFIQFIVSPLSRLFIVLERQRFGLVLQINLLVLRIMGLGLAALTAVELLHAVIWYSVFSCGGFVIYVIAIAHITSNKLGSFLREWLCSLLWATSINSPLIMVFILDLVEPNHLVVAVIMSMILTVLYWSHLGRYTNTYTRANL